MVVLLNLSIDYTLKTGGYKRLGDIPNILAMVVLLNLSIDYTLKTGGTEVALFSNLLKLNKDTDLWPHPYNP